MSVENKVWNEENLKEAIEQQWGKYGVHADVFNLILSLIKSMTWTEYSWENKKSHPPKPSKYLIYREGCDKVHFEKWNGSGWSSSNNDCTHWLPVPKPEKFNIKRL